MKLEIENLNNNATTYIYNFSKDENHIEIWYNNDPTYMKYTVVGFSGNELRLQVDYTTFNYNYLGGVMVFKK